MKSLVFLLALLLTCFVTSAQDKTPPAGRSSFGFSAGYGLPLASENIDSQSSNYAFSPSTLKGIYGSYGSGIYLNAFFRRMFSPSFGLDIGVHYLIGHQYQGGQSTQFPGVLNIETRHTSANGIFISPALIFQLSESKFRPYMKTGFVLGWLKSRFDDSWINTNNGSTTWTQDIEKEYSGRISIGLKGTLGAELSAGKRSVFFTEISIISMNYFPAKARYTKYDVNGSSQLSSMTTIQKEFVYKREYDSRANTDPSKPQVQQQISIPMSSLLLSVGMRFTLK